MLTALLFSVLTEFTRTDCSPVYIESRAVVVVDYSGEGSKITLQGGIVVDVCESPKEVIAKLSPDDLFHGIPLPHGTTIQSIQWPTLAPPLPAKPKAIPKIKSIRELLWSK